MSNVGHHLLSGASSGFAATLILQPFDLLKTRLQKDDTFRSRASVVRVARGIVASDGFKGLWSGSTASLIRNVPGIAMYMTALSRVRFAMANSPYFAAVRAAAPSENSSTLPRLSTTGNLVAGATTRVGVGFLLNPFSVLKARYESNMYTYPSFSTALVSLVRAGPSELFRGFAASSLRDAPYAGLFVVFYESIKQELSRLAPSNSSANFAVVHSFSAAAAGAVATMVTHPFDVIKTKIQVRREEPYHGLVMTVRTIWKQRGISGFLDGASLRLSRKVASSAIGWAVYEGLLILVNSNGRV
ncbi:solute carrier family 25 member 38 [Thelephora terrestris]|uniref:Mitochondrial glycine transporter n=1 Tax=Thelephora terrestris TaxID=56493 RepID=A0A9P6H966_9AGAM|nr:solute carrier family 25 member 38 [Thelephora terrestris]